MGANGRSPYCATKFGVEAISDCLRLEMKKFNVEVSVSLFKLLSFTFATFARFALWSLVILLLELPYTMRILSKPKRSACGMEWYILCFFFLNCNCNL